MDLKRHLHLGGEHLLGCLNPEVGYLPYWHMTVWPDKSAQFQFRRHCTGHNVGRWWNTLLRLEHIIGFAIPDTIEAAMLNQTWRLCDNPTGILLEDQVSSDPGTWYIHSYRETMLALGLLVQYRHSAQARRQGLRAIEHMARASSALTHWDLGDGLVPKGRGANPVYTHGRAIEGLLCFYRASGEEAALAEAQRLAHFHREHTLATDGRFATGCTHHTHSYLNTVRGLLEWAALTDQPDLVDQIRATYFDAITTMITPSGFIPHDIGARYEGDIAAPGDIAHIALMLWDHCGDAGLLDDAERYVRCRLLPAQVLQPMPLTPRDPAAGDACRDLAQRFVGAIGGSVGHVRGQTCVTDFTAAALHSLLELYDRTVDLSAHQVRVNFHFDFQLPDIDVRATRNDTAGTLTVHNATGKNLLVRVPGWTRPDSLRLTLALDGALPQTVPVNLHNGFALISRTDAPHTVRLTYDLPEAVRREESRDQDAMAEQVTFTWRGDQIHRVEPGGPYMAPWPKETPPL